MPPTVLAQPQVRRIRQRSGGSLSRRKSIRLRCLIDRAWPSCRVVRPSIAEDRDFCVTCGVTQAFRRSATNAAASKPLSAPSLSCRVDPGEWRWIEPWARHWSE